MMFRLAFLLVAFATAVQAAEPRFIGDVEADKATWERMIGVPMVIEGRVSAVSRGTLRFVNSQLQVVLPASAKPRGGETYRVRGELRKGPVLPEFHAISITKAAPDSEQLQLAQSRLQPDDPTGWFELADRFYSRSQFYDDDDLFEDVRAVERKGIEARITVAGNDESKLQSVATLARERGHNLLADELAHRAARLMWRALRTRLSGEDADALTETELLLDRLQRDLPGANEPMSERRPPLEQAYLRDPLAMFERADVEQRRLLARLLLSEILDGLMEARLDETASNAARLASELEARLPDRPDLADKYRQRGMTAAIAAVATMTEGEVKELAAQLRSSGQGEQAERAIAAWLDSRLESVRQRGPGEIFKLAQDYERLTDDTDQAITLYQEALKLDDRMIGAKQALQTLGYEQVAGEWRKQRPRATASGATPSLQLGEVDIGMSEEEVRAAFRTAPSRVNRIATFGEVTEVWVYTDFGQVITLSRRGTDGEARVTDVSDLDR